MAHSNITPTQAPAWNPLRADPQAAGLSSYLGVENGRLTRLLQRQQDCTADELALHERLKQKMLAPGFPCVAARSVINRKTYRLGVYEGLGTPEAALALCHDLCEFTHEFAPGEAPFTSFIAAFKGPLRLSEIDFESLLWRQLQLIHEIDVRHFEWDANVSKDPNDSKFSFSVGGRAFFVIGLHQGSSRLARTFDQPCLVFNPHDQFEALRADGTYGKLQRSIRQRDLTLQGSVNPMLDDFGQQAETRQYSGRHVPPHWKCPFMHQAQSCN